MSWGSNACAAESEVTDIPTCGFFGAASRFFVGKRFVAKVRAAWSEELRALLRLSFGDDEGATAAKLICHSLDSDGDPG